MEYIVKRVQSLTHDNVYPIFKCEGKDIYICYDMKSQKFILIDFTNNKVISSNKLGKLIKQYYDYKYIYHKYRFARSCSESIIVKYYDDKVKVDKWVKLIDNIFLLGINL